MLKSIGRVGVPLVLAVMGVAGCAGMQSGGTEAIALQMVEPAERVWAIRDFPVTMGVVFMKGELTSPGGGAVKDDLGRTVESEAQETGWWDARHESIKWLLLKFNASSDRHYSFVIGEKPRLPGGEKLARQDAGGITVDTGPMQVHIPSKGGQVFDSVTLEGRAMVSGEAPFELYDDEGTPLSCGDTWTLTLEENTPACATIKAEGLMHMAQKKGEDLAQMVIRYQFFKNESFIRVYDTFVWRQLDNEWGAAKIGLRFKPNVGPGGKIKVGLSDYLAGAESSAFSAGTDLAAYQDDAEHFSITQDGKTLGGGRRLGGWLAVEDAEGRGAGVAMKNLWQTYPRALGVRGGFIDVGIWPEQAGRFGWEQRDFQPDTFYYNRGWASLGYTPSISSRKSFPGQPNQLFFYLRDGGATFFNTRDVRAGRGEKLVEALRAQALAGEASPGKWLVGKMDAGLAERIKAYRAGEAVSDGFKARIVHNWDRLIAGGQSLYDEASWKNVPLRARCKILLAEEKPDKSDLIWLNRLLIESAYPEDLDRTDVDPGEGILPHAICEDDWLGNAPWPHDSFLYTGQGEGPTTELTLFFYGPGSARTMDQVNSITQHPVAMRQDPVSAMRVPFEGFDLAAANPGKYPGLERAIDQTARMNLARWPLLHDYGFLRFGFTRWDVPGSISYRWIDGVQYDSQLLPWLMFLRGGDRYYYEEGVNTARWAMDVSTNQYNTRGTPAGYQGLANTALTPWAKSLTNKSQKIHFLNYCWHMTGYVRAREIRDMMIANTKEDYERKELKKWGGGREQYNMNWFLADAYMETFDPEILKIARAALDYTLTDQYDAGKNTFKEPVLYLFEGLIDSLQVFPDDPRLIKVLTDYGGGVATPGLVNGGLTERVYNSIALEWLYRHTGDPAYARIMWDLAKGMADIVPNYDWSSGKIAAYPADTVGQFHCRIWPMLVGLSLSEKHGLSFGDSGSVFRDMYVGIGNSAAASRAAFIRSKVEGEVTVRASVHLAGQTPVTGTAVSWPGGEAAGELKDGVLVIRHARAGDTYKLTLQGGGPGTYVLLLSDDAKIVREVGDGARGYLKFDSGAGQYSTAVRVVMRMKQDDLVIDHLNASGPYTIRDAVTHELLGRNDMSDQRIANRYTIGKGRLVEVLLAGTYWQWRFEGAEPYLAGRAEDWFSPGE